MQGLGNWAGLPCPYHPQSSEKVEKYNGIIKDRLAKLMQEKGRRVSKEAMARTVASGSLQHQDYPYL